MQSAQRVTKTLVIGLGSTGARICDRIAERIAWEIGSLPQAPWVEFLCVETNAGEQSKLRYLPARDFRNLTITSQQYAQILENPDAYDAKIHLKKWWDRGTLEKLPGLQVEAGAGNIRMVGRLAFLFDPNHDAVHSMVKERLDRLRQLNEADARDRRGRLPSGEDLPLEFAHGGQVRVFVVGTLCGGTGSGLASDFGFFLHKLTGVNERSLCIFTLPRPDMGAADEGLASKHKKNAFTALSELNHYYLNNRYPERPVRFPDAYEANPQRYPYDMPFIVMPTRVGSDGEQELNRAVADRVFLNVFSPDTDPFAKGVDATIYADRDHHAHVFNTFGLASLEYPVQRIMEACRDQLLSYTLQQWVSRTVEDEVLKRRVKDLGFTREQMTKSVLQAADGGDLQAETRRLVSQVVSKLRNNPTEAHQDLAALRQHLSRGGKAYTTLLNAKSRAALQISERIKGEVRQRLMDFYEGPGVMLQVLGKANELTEELRKHTPAAASGGAVDDLMRRADQYRRSSVLSFTQVKRKAMDHVLKQVEQELHKEVSARLDQLALLVMLDQPGEPGRPAEAGVLTRLNHQLRRLQSRLTNLRGRLNQEIDRLTENVSRQQGTRPQINGRVIFDTDTVDGEYRHCLEQWAMQRDYVAEWTQGRDQKARELLRAWSEMTAIADGRLPDALLAEREGLWVDSMPSSSTTKRFLPDEVLDVLENEAVEPFKRLANEDVLERWVRLPNRDDETRAVVKLARPFLNVDRALAEQGNRSPVAGRKVLLLPRGGKESHEQFARLVEAGVGNLRHDESPDGYRAVLLEETYRFPLRGAVQILSQGGIAEAINQDIPNFYTRNDVFWTGLTAAFREKLELAEELVATGVLLRLLEPRGGVLAFSWTPNAIGDTTERRLPLDFYGASSFLAREERDLQNKSLQGALQEMHNRVHAQVLSRGSDGYRAFLDQLETSLQGGGFSAIEGWDTEKIGELIERFSARDERLYEAYLGKRLPSQASREVLFRCAGSAKVGGGEYDRDGYYCRKCGGVIGHNERDAARNAWKCYVDPSHNVYA
ncbi:tubulin-like doman-containing protein [Deinococcus depolymerans]|uniref:Tubulin-like doman-containing protein n=1 Tax=Deinococcus depolymerans TaxID=392408 RepID=A0ABP3M9X8_9DEIO